MLVMCLGLMLSALPAASTARAAQDGLTANMIQTTPAGKVTGNIYMEDGKVRNEFTMQGQRQVTITRHDKNVVWLLMPGGMYMEMPVPAEQDRGMPILDQDEMRDVAKRTRIGTETVNGHVCDVYRFDFKDPDAGRVTQWVARDLDFPVRIKVQTDQGVSVTEFTDIEKGPVPDRMFEIPPGYQKMTAPGMGRGMGAAPGMPQGLPEGMPKGMPRGVPGQ
jgi:hypothetical protein